MQYLIRKAWWLILAAAVVWILTAVNSHGYYHADEHYQIIEFAGLKLGTHEPDELAWEFKTQIRSGLQPTIVYILFSVFESVGLTDPYFQMQGLRIFWALCCYAIIVWIILSFAPKLRHKVSLWVLMVCSLFLWFIPYLAVRFSSETFSGIFLLLSGYFLMRDNMSKGRFFLAGLFLGISFLARYQIGFCLIGILGWMLFTHKSIKSFGFLSTGGLLILVTGTLIDRWFYGEWVLPALNYLDMTISQEAASSFGVAPWYFFMEEMLLAPGWPLGVLFYTSLLVLIYFKPKSIWTWLIIPFVLAHSIVPHKELRFLFPFVFVLPFLLVEAFDLLWNRLKHDAVRVRVSYLVLFSLFVINSIGLVILGSKSAGLGRTAITKYLHEKSLEEDIQLVHTAWSNPYNPWQSLPSKHYMDDIVFSRFENIYTYSDTLFDVGKKSYLSLRKEELNDHILPVLERDFDLVLESVPQWVQELNSFYGGLDTGQVFMLYTPKQERDS